MSVSFWANKPVRINKKKFTSNLIVSADTLLENSDNEIKMSKIQLDYDVILNSDDDCKNNLLKFINNNYGDDKSNLVLQYSKNLLDYFINPDSLCIVFYSKGNKLLHKYNYDKMIGLIVAKKHNLVIRDDVLEFKTYNCIDIDFLCLIKQLRNLHVSSFMINVVTKECMLQYDKQVPCAVYTVNKRLKVDSFCKKTYYHRPLQIENLLLTDMLDVNGGDNLNFEQTTKLLKKLYNTFSYTKDFFKNYNLEYYTKIQLNQGTSDINGKGTSDINGKGTSDNNDNDNNNNNNKDIVELIHDNLLNYNKVNHDIYEYKSITDIEKMLSNPVFHKFIIRNKGGDIVDFVCLYNLDTYNIKTKTSSRNGHFYSMFLHDNSSTYMSYVLEIISEYCYKNNVFDLLTIMNVLNVKPEEYRFYKLLRGSASLYYYVYNIEIPHIQSHKNGLVTI